MASRKGKFKASKVRPLAEAVRGWIEDIDQRCEICGSLRRLCPEVGDVDLVISGPTLAVANRMTEVCAECGPDLTIMTADLNKSKKSLDLLIDDVQFNIYVASAEAWGAMTLFLTGNMVFNVLTRTRAKQLGYKLNQYGLWQLDGDLIAARSEEVILEALGVVYLPPEKRTLNYGEQLELLWPF